MQENLSQLLGVAAVTAALVAVIAFLLWNRASDRQTKALAEQLEASRELEKEIHIRERDFLAERNRLEIEKSEAIRAAQVGAFEKGREQGIVENHAAHISELATQRSELLKKVEEERESAASEAREKLRAEYELQSKLFTVKITPYVSITEDKGLIRNEFETVAGYQYQLLVNGIPAFSPHLVPEHTEVKRSLNPEVEKALIQTAQRAADAAIDMYLGGNGQFAKLAAPIIKRLPK
jgi:hypothetical protein